MKPSFMQGAEANRCSLTHETSFFRTLLRLQGISFSRGYLGLGIVRLLHSLLEGALSLPEEGKIKK